MVCCHSIVKDVKLEYFPDFLPKNDKRKKIELNAPIGGIPNQTVKKRIFNNPRIYDFTVMCKRRRWRRWRSRSLDLFERRWYIRLKLCQRTQNNCRCHRSSWVPSWIVNPKQVPVFQSQSKTTDVVAKNYHQTKKNCRHKGVEVLPQHKSSYVEISLKQLPS